MSSSKPSEKYAMEYIGRVLSLPVSLHDNSNRGGDSLHDLLVKSKNGQALISVEVKRFVSQTYIETVNNAINDKHYIRAAHDWDVLIYPKAPIKQLKVRIPPIIKFLESKSLLFYAVGTSMNVLPKYIINTLKSLCVESLSAIPKPDSTSKSTLTFSVQGLSSHPTLSSDDILKEVETFIHKKKYEKQWKKLVAKSTTDNFHIFMIWLNPQAIQSVPSRFPNLPDGVNGLWITGFHEGLYWSSKTEWMLIPHGHFPV